MSQQTKERTAGGGSPPELPKQYRPTDHEGRIRARWEASGAFHADPGRVLRGEARPYSVVIPPPNVTAQLHLGHALNNTLQDVLVRAHRMMGYETLWMPGTDHAGIATQTVVEKRVLKEEGKRRTDFERAEFVKKIQAFKDEYEAVITGQLKAMGCSCDWERQRFTMDEVCARAVNEAFFRLFRDGLIYRGKRLVNWDPVTQTALSDDEVEMEEVDGKFYYLRYPLVDPLVQGSDPGAGQSVEASEGEEDLGNAFVPCTWSELRQRGYPVPADADHQDEEQAYITVATTRPETYLGDTAVAVNPKDPRAKALRGLLVELPLVGRVIPIVEDDYVVMPAADPDAEGVDPKAKFATGFLKVTPAHDPNDYELGRRHNLAIINVMAPDASISDKHGWADVGDGNIFVGRSREEARELVVKEFRARGLLGDIKPYRHSVGHSYRSHAAIEPYLSDQWYVKVTDLTLRDAALRAMADDQRTTVASVAAEVADLVATGHKGRSAGDGALRFYPERYARTFELWHQNIRDWCISRQLWWGHQIPVWTAKYQFRIDEFAAQRQEEYPDLPLSSGEIRGICMESALDAPVDVFVEAGCGESDFAAIAAADDTIHLCPRTALAAEVLCKIDKFWRKNQHLLDQPGWPEPSRLDRSEGLAGVSTESLIEMVRGLHSFERDPDVLDTWFSSALWPMSTMLWPESSDLLKAFNPTSVLCTAREIITLWVSRMTMFNRYFLPDGWPRENDTGRDGRGNGPVPFKDVFIHAMIQDGEGRKMSKSLGNGVDPLDIIASHGADAMRFVLCQMTTQTQDVRMPVERDAATGKNTSPKFDLGRNLCNKLWQVSTGFALAKLGTPDGPEGSRPLRELLLIDRWMLSRLASATEQIGASLTGYQFSDYAQSLYDLLWRDFCDWYVEGIKPTVGGDPMQRAVLAHTLETIVRLLHPITPFITEAIWERLKDVRTLPIEGIELGPSRKAGLLATAGWPSVSGSLRDRAAEIQFERLRELITAIREVRAQHNVPPRRKVTLHCPPELDAECRRGGSLVETLAVVDRITSERPTGPAAAFAFGMQQCHLSNLADEVDVGAERARLEKVIADNEKSIRTLEGRLNNPGYAQKAPPAMVKQTQDQLAKAVAERDAAAAALRTLA